MPVYVVFEDQGLNSEMHSIWATREDAEAFIKGTSRWYVSVETVLEGEAAKAKILQRQAGRA